MSKIDIRKCNTGKFLREFKLLERMDSLYDAPDDTPGRSPKKAPAGCITTPHPFDPLVETGDIRLFSQTERITYGVVLPWDELHALIVPLSRFDNPANASEFYAENAENGALFMRVYQVWNTRTVLKCLLSRTWKTGRVSDAELERLKQMLRHEMLGEKLPDDLLNKSGLGDMRLARLMNRYQDAELKNFSPLDGEDMQLETALDNLPEFDFRPLRGSFESVMAAAGGETLSPVYLRKGKKWVYLGAVEMENFRRVKAGNALPLFSWFSESLQVELGWRVVAFRDAGSHALLGAGVIEPEIGGGAAIRLRYPADKREIPDISSPAGIEIVILEP